MKCPNCGAPLKMEDKFCTYCGAPNTLALKHQADMEHYEREFTETQEEVLKTSRKAGSLTGLLIALLVLFILNIVAIIVSTNTWEIKYDRKASAIDRHADEYREILDEMIDQQDYLALRSFHNSNNLSSSQKLREYTAIVHYAGNLEDICYYLCDMDPYNDKLSEDRIDSTVSAISYSLISLYEDPKDSYFEDSAVTDEKLAVISDIRKQAEALLVTYGGYTKEETDELRNMSKSRITESLKEHLLKLHEEHVKEKADESPAQTDSTGSMSAEEFLQKIIEENNLRNKGGDDA